MSEEFFPYPPARGDVTKHIGELPNPSVETSASSSLESNAVADEKISSTRHCEGGGVTKQSHIAATEDSGHRAMAERANTQSRLASTFLAAFLGGVLALTGAYLLIAADVVRLPSSSSAPTIGPTGAPLVNTSIADPDWGSVAETVKPSTVTVRATGGGQGSQGAGFIFDEDGHVVTNTHVVSGHDSFSIQLESGLIVEASVAGMDAATDIAVLTMKNPPSGLQAASLGDSSVVFVGEPVAAIGNPLGLSQSVSTGIISAINRPVSTEEPGGEGRKIVTNAIQIDAATNEGNSGGALVDGEGRVIGVTSALASVTGEEGEAKASGIGFAIPINLVKQIAAQLISDGAAQHAKLGVVTQSVWVKAGDISQLGAQVTGFDKSSPAQRAGIRVNDTIIAVGSSPVVSEASLMGTIHEYQPGDTVTVELVRGVEVLSLDVQLTGN